jgi:hypothetical protein
MAHNIPGIYYFFIGEERGGIGSNKVASVFDTVDHLRGVKRCVSFDRRNYYSIITQQLGRQCCSNEFATALANELNKSGLKISLDPTGIYTDSASFIDEIAECTNISVGYFMEHTQAECQDISYLTLLVNIVLEVDWESLPTSRDVTAIETFEEEWEYDEYLEADTIYVGDDGDYWEDEFEEYLKYVEKMECVY